MDPKREQLVLLLLEEGSRYHAVKMYEEEAGVRRAQARAAVDQLAQRHGILVPRHRPLTYMLIAAAGLVGAYVSYL